MKFQKNIMIEKNLVIMSSDIVYHRPSGACVNNLITINAQPQSHRLTAKVFNTRTAMTVILTILKFICAITLLNKKYNPAGTCLFLSVCIFI